MTTTRPTPRTIISFGYLHGDPPRADLTLDVRRYLRDPAVAKDTTLLDLDGRDRRVRDVVLRTPGAPDAVAVAVHFLTTFPAAHPAALAIGCAGGRHRSAALAEEVARILGDAGSRVVLEHRHIHLPRVVRT